MGIRFSLESSHHRQDEDRSAAFWIGCMPNPGPLPSCWDELVDWTEDATEIFQVYLRIRKAEADDASIEEEMQFIPFVSREKSAQIHSLPSWKWLQRAQFFAENVRVSRSAELRKSLISHPCLLCHLGLNCCIEA